MQLAQGDYNLPICELSRSEEGQLQSARDEQAKEIEFNSIMVESLAKSQKQYGAQQNRTILEVEGESQDEAGTLIQDQFLTKMTSRQSESSASLAFS